MRYLLILLLLCGCSKPELTPEPKPARKLLPSEPLTQEQLTYPDFIDDKGVGWTIITKYYNDGYFEQELIRTPFYVYEPEPKLSYLEQYYKRELGK